MFQKKILSLFLIVCCSVVKCEEIDPGNLNCDQYGNDLEIISQFPFNVNLNYKQQGPGISTAILDSTGISVSMIQLRQSGAQVPPSVFCLKNVQSLEITNMNFVDDILPHTLANLPLLFSLSITNTPITKVTNQVTSLQRLESLTLDNCGLTEMPNLHGMDSLLRLSLPNNRLTELHGLSGVRQLFLYHNLFTSIPTQTETDALVTINMNYNPVNDLKHLTSHSNLTEVRLSNTDISVIPTEIDQLDKLTFLDFSFSKITEIPQTILKLPRLQYLIVQGNTFLVEQVNTIKSEFNTQRPDIQLLI